MLIPCGQLIIVLAGANALLNLTLEEEGGNNLEQTINLKIASTFIIQ